MQERLSLHACGQALIYRQGMVQYGHMHRGMPDGSPSIDCHARPCWPLVKCINMGACIIAGFLDPIVGLGKLGSRRVWFPVIRFEEEWSWGWVEQME